MQLNTRRMPFGTQIPRCKEWFVYHSAIRFSVNLKNEIGRVLWSNFLFHFSFFIRKIKNPILVFHFSIDERKLENEFIICFPCALKTKWSPLFVNTRNTWYGVFGRCWRRLRVRLSYLVGVKRWKIYQIKRMIP